MGKRFTTACKVCVPVSLAAGFAACLFFAAGALVDAAAFVVVAGIGTVLHAVCVFYERPCQKK